MHAYICIGFGSKDGFMIGKCTDFLVKIADLGFRLGFIKSQSPSLDLMV